MLSHNAQLGYANARKVDDTLDKWCRQHQAVAEAIVEQLDRYAIPLTADEYALQIGRRLSAAMHLGPERAVTALGLEVRL